MLNTSYICDDCEKPVHASEDAAWVDVKGKLWTKDNYDVAGGH